MVNGIIAAKDLKEIVAFTIRSIVERFGVTVDGDEFVLPVSVESVEKWMEEIEKQTSFYWRRDNSTNYEVEDRDGNVVISFRWKERPTLI